MDRSQPGAGPPQPSAGGGAHAQPAPRAVGGAAFRTAEWLVLAAAIAVAHLFQWRLVLFPSACDSQDYLGIAAEIRRDGLFANFEWSEVRPYGYPLFLSVLLRAASALGVPVGWVVLEVQLSLYLLAASFFRRRVAERWPSLAPWAFAGIVLNPFALAYAPESLTESLSLTLFVFAAGCWIALFARPASSWMPVLAGSLAAGAAVIVRPANLFALAAWVLAVAAVCVERRAPPRAWLSSAVALVAGCALPLVPQYVNNVRNYGEHTPLIVASLGHDQQVWGVKHLKYATVLPVVPTGQHLSASRPRVFYQNPFSEGTTLDEKKPLSWYVEYPGAGALTLALHVFCMLDQDLLFTYSRDLDPWYRIPVGILNHGLIGLAVVGIGLLAVRARRERALVLVATAVAAYALAHAGLHATTLVEMRFGLPLLLLAGPSAAAAIRALVERPPWRVRAGAFAVAWIVCSLSLSHWVRQQSQAIRVWEKGGREAFAERKQESAMPLKTVGPRAGVGAERARGLKEKRAKAERAPATGNE
jgi:hypothetical protein